MKTYILQLNWKKILVNVALIQTTYCLQCNLKLYSFICDKIYNYTKSPIS